MKESGCVKSPKGCVVENAVKDYEGTYPDYQDALRRQQEGIGDRAVVNKEILLYKFLLLQAARETQNNACPNCPFIISNP